MQFHIKDINFVDDFFIIFTRSKEYDIVKFIIYFWKQNESTQHVSCTGTFSHTCFQECKSLGIFQF